MHPDPLHPPGSPIAAPFSPPQHPEFYTKPGSDAVIIAASSGECGIKTLKVSAAGKPAVKEREASKPTVKQHLAAIRMLFDWLVVGQVLAINPAHAVRAPKHIVRRGKTPVLIEEQARRLLESIKTVRKTKLPDGTEVEQPWVVGIPLHLIAVIY